jgi:hypothetical protein
VKGVLSPKGLLLAAALFALVFALAHAFGLRAYTAILSGTSPPGGDGPEAWALGVGYVLAYFAAMVGAPILALGAALLAGLGRLQRRL